MSFIAELKSRGLIHDVMPGTEELLNKESVTGYIGFDPTGDSLHIGNLVPVTLLMRFQQAGHRPVALVGGATGLIGDPSGKSAERSLLSREIIEHNLNSQKKQLEKFLDFSPGPNQAKIVNNYDWFKDIGFLDFIRDVGKHISVNYMMAKDSVKNRLEQGISFTEFSYQLIQGYDFLHLYRHHGCRLQMGGSDQWGNIVTGTELIRRIDGGEAFALTAPLLTKADGSKFGKSEGGNIWLDRFKTSPYKFYQYWLNLSDEDSATALRTFSMKPVAELNDAVEQHAAAPHLRELQKMLAAEMTVRVHSDEDLRQSIEASEILFGKGSSEALNSLPVELVYSVFEGLPAHEISADKLNEGINVINFLADETGIFPSRGEARKMLVGGGLSINRNKITDPDAVLSGGDLVQQSYILVQKGKKNYHLVKKA